MKSPAFQFYPKDFLSDLKVRIMPPHVRGQYIVLLCVDWLEDGIPEDDMWALSESGIPYEEWLKGSSPLLRRCFILHPTKVGFLTNPRLLVERENQAKWREKCSQGGRTSGAIRKSLAVSRISESKGTTKGSTNSLRSKREVKGNTPNSYLLSANIEEDTNVSSSLETLPKKVDLAPKISMTQNEIQSLITEFGKESCAYYKNICSDWLVANGKTKKNSAAFMRNWIRKEIAERKGFYYPKKNENGFRPHTAANTAEKNMKYLEDQYGKESVEDMFDTFINGEKKSGAIVVDGGGVVPLAKKS